MLGRQVFLDSLLAHGVTKIFGNPGTTETPLLDNLGDYPELEYIFHLHEGVAVGAANFYAQASNTTAVASMHVAPGLGNAIGMIYGAMKNHSPMVVTAGAQDTRIRLSDPLLGHDLVSMAASVTKWSVQVEHADEMAVIMQRAFKIANEYPKGPVFVALPINVMEQETKIPATTAGKLKNIGLASVETIDELADLVRRSRNVGIVAGDDVVTSGAREALVAFSEKVGAGVHLEIVSGQLPFPSKHPHFLGRVGPDSAAHRAVLGGYDTVLLIGGPFFEDVWHSESIPFAENVTLIQLELTESRLAHNYHLSLGVAADIKDTLERLLERVGAEPIYRERCKALDKSFLASKENRENEFAKLKDRSPMTPERAMYELGLALPEDVVISEESITCAPEVLRNFDIGGKTPFFAPRGGGIGHGLCGCLGVALAYRDKQVIAISGDGSAMYSIQGLWTAAHHKLNIMFVILSNREYRILKHNMNNYRQRFDVESNGPYVFMDLTDPTLNFVEMAKGMGVPGRKVDSPYDIADAVSEALSVEGPYMLDLVVGGLESK